MNTITDLPRARSPGPAARKQAIPVAVREQVWIQKMGSVFQGKCKVTWCENKITVFDFQSGHNIPESKGGATTVANLVPICSRCNQTMGDRFSIDEWNKAFHGTIISTSCCRYFSCKCW